MRGGMRRVGELSRARRSPLSLPRPERSAPLAEARSDRPLAKLPLARLPPAAEEEVPAAEEKRLETEPEKAARDARDEDEPVRADAPSFAPPLPAIRVTA